ncbi:MAG: hypothetical protein H0T47_14040 [Planctomycetaceae bacterium]|nr:hypothetical protein [Planctomycetaceae bacterium]
MSRLVLTLLAVGLVVSGIGVAGAGGGKTDREKELLAEIKSLRQRVEALEEKLKNLEAGTPTLKLDMSPAEPFAPPHQPDGNLWRLPQPPASFLPNGSVQREFNGMTYYVIPITGSGGNAATASTIIAEPAPSAP